MKRKKKKNNPGREEEEALTKPKFRNMTLLRQGQHPRGATPPPRSGGCRRRRVEKSYSTFKVRRGGNEKIPIVQGKEQRLHLAGAAVKRYPTSKVRETQVRR